MDNPNAGLEHYINGTVYDSSGEKVGKVENVYLNDGTGEPEFATVSTGWFGSNVSFVPLGSARVEGDSIHVPHTKDQIKDAPNIDADRHLDEAEEAELFRYYGVGGGVGQSETTGIPGSMDADVDRDSDLGDDDSVVRREERLNVGTERVESGRLRLRKHVVTHNEQVTVPVEREEVEIVREPVSGGRTGGDLGDDEVDVDRDRDIDRDDLRR